MINNSRESPKAYFQWVVIAHVATLVVGVSWAFGGNADWVRTPISIWASLGAVLTAVVLLRPQTRDRVLAGSRAWAIPIVALNALVLTSCLTPGFKPLSFAGNDAFLIPVRISWWIPSSARPGRVGDLFVGMLPDVSSRRCSAPLLSRIDRRAEAPLSSGRRAARRSHAPGGLCQMVA